MRMTTVFLAVAGLNAGLAHAQSYTASNAGGPEWARPFADGTCCSGLGPVRWHAQEFFVSANGTYNVRSVQNQYDGYLFVYSDRFDPTAQTANFVAGDDDGNGGIGTSDIEGVTLDGNRTYVIVTTGFSNGDEGTFTNTVDGNGTATFQNFADFLASLGPTAAEELRRLAADAHVSGRILVLNADTLAGSQGQSSLTSRDAAISFIRVADPETGESNVRMSTKDVPGMMGNVYTWVEISGFHAKDDPTNRRYSGYGLQAGADIAITPNAVLGLSLGTRKLDSGSAGFTQTGDLYFAQPYLAYRSGPWSIEASLLYGFGDYTQTSGGGTGTGSSRLAAATINGGYEFVLDERTTMTPMAELTYGTETVEGRTGTLAGAGSQTTSFTQASVGAELRQAFGSGDVFVGLHADWLGSTSPNPLVSNLLVDNGLTGRIAFGGSVNIADGLSINTGIEFSGLGGRLQQTNGTLGLSYRF